MTQEVYLLTRRGVLHRGSELQGNVATMEGCNLDDTTGMEIEFNEMKARRAADRLCRRCFPGDRLRK